MAVKWMNFKVFTLDLINRTFNRRPARENSARLPAEMNGRIRETQKKKNSTGWGCAIGFFFLFSTSCGGIDSWKNVSFPARFEIEGRHGTAVTSGGGRDLSLWKKKLMMMTVSCYRTSRRGIFGILFFFRFHTLRLLWIIWIFKFYANEIPFDLKWLAWFRGVDDAPFNFFYFNSIKMDEISALIWIFKFYANEELNQIFAQFFFSFISIKVEENYTLWLILIFKFNANEKFN